MMGKDISDMSTKDIIGLGAAFIHSDRMDRGLLLGQNVLLNVLLGNQYSALAVDKGKIDYKKIEGMTEKIFDQYQVSPKKQCAAA